MEFDKKVLQRMDGKTLQCCGRCHARHEVSTEVGAHEERQPVTFVDHEGASATDPNEPLFHIQWDRANESLFSVLMEKTEGEERDRVKEVPAGDGLEAYRRVHHWFTMTTATMSHC